MLLQIDKNISERLTRRLSFITVSLYNRFILYLTYLRYYLLSIAFTGIYFG